MVGLTDFWGRFHKLFSALRPTFEKLFRVAAVSFLRVAWVWLDRIVFWAGAMHGAACLSGDVDVGCHAWCC